MQKIEKWRLLHLSRILGNIAGLLTEGSNSEWGNVFRHFQVEAQAMADMEGLQIETILRFISNIKNCFTGQSSFRHLKLSHQDSKARDRLNRDFFEDKAELQEIMSEIERLSHEYKH
jgi:hypothetical protein